MQRYTLSLHLFLPLLATLILNACVPPIQPPTASPFPNTRTPPQEAQADYWDGETYAGQPVFNPFEGLTWEAHQELLECGLDDQANLNNWTRSDFATEDGRLLISLDGRPQLLLLVEPGIYGLSTTERNTIVLTIMKKEENKEPYAIGSLRQTALAAGVFELICDPET
jgi:hypothetical protein